jgi:hypothetical protein
VNAAKEMAGEGEKVRYLLLIWSEEAPDDYDFSSPEAQEVMNEYWAYGAALEAAGQTGPGEALQPSTTATMVTVRDGRTVTSDGPFLETKEQLGGYYTVDCDNLDQAIDWAAKCPGAKYGRIEIRPVIDFSGFSRA